MPTSPSLNCPREPLSPRSRLASVGLTARDFVTWLIGHSVAEVERELVLLTLRHCSGNRTRSARVLGISVRTLRNKISEYAVQGIAVPEPSQAGRDNQVAIVWLQARLCAERAERASRDEERRLFIYLRNSWIEVANDMQFADSQKSGAASYAARRDAA
jgi:hypothetical protein